MNIDRLRLVVAVAHAMPGARLALTCKGGYVLSSSHGEGADIGLCQIRRVVLASALPCQPNHADRVEQVEFAGGDADIGCGIVFQPSTGCHWFGTYLQPRTVEELARRVIPERVRYAIVADPGLGVSVVRFLPAGSESLHPVSRTVWRLFAECAERELGVSIDHVGSGGLDSVRGPK